ncbi:uncharacterized protein [Nicotiana sylvestris]|uniref:uncharacterized protein n=1 Tax=Nicotiana sylvestris TaxID=4096 RepID=UPI00388CE6F0
MGMRLEYNPPSHRDGKVVIQIDEDDVSELKEYWEIALIGLLVGYWNADALSKIASDVAMPMYTDKYIAELNKISYARVLVKVDITKSLVENVEIVTPNGIKQQEILYEWKPKFCNKCLHFGYDVFECWKLIKQEEDAEFKALKRRNRGRRRRVVQEWKSKDQQEQDERNGKVTEMKPPIEGDKGKRNSKANTDQRRMMIHRDDDTERQNTSIDQHGKIDKVSNANRFRVLEEYGQTSAQGGGLTPDPIQHPS